MSPLLIVQTCAAESLKRDPTAPPPALNAPLSVRQPLDDLRAEHIVVVNGVRYLVWNSRRYAVGESLAGARIERISESAIWLESNGTVRKVPVFQGVEKLPLPDASAVTRDDVPTNAKKRDQRSRPKNEK